MEKNSNGLPLKISIATSAETPDVFEMFKSFTGEDLTSVGMDYDKDVLLASVERAIEARTVLIFTDDFNHIFAAVAGALQSSAFSKDVLFSAALFYVHPDWRGKTVTIIKELRKFLSFTDATQMVISSPSYAGEAMNRFYHMQGGKSLEKHFIFKIEKVAA